MGVLREDVVRVSFEVESNGLKGLGDSISRMTQGVSQGVSGAEAAIKGTTDYIEKMKKAVSNVGHGGMELLKGGVDQAAGAFGGLSGLVEKAKAHISGMGGERLSPLHNGLEGVSGTLTTIGERAAGAAYNGLKKMAGLSFQALEAGVKGVGALVGASVWSYADTEQLIGGVDTLFQGSSGKVQAYADHAYKTAGLSANQYMETVTGFSASLLQSLGGDTDQAADLANQAIVDMSDNANKMGSSMGSIQDAYQGFAKQNYTMLDNLKLGYGGTQEEMQRLIRDAAAIDDSIDSNSMSYANILKAIHAVQENMKISGLTAEEAAAAVANGTMTEKQAFEAMGTTSKEAATTISGSFASMKSAWGNLLPALITGGDSFDRCVDNLIDSAKTFGGNIMPAIEKALGGVGKLVEKVAPMIEKELPGLVELLLPSLVKAASSLVSGLIKALPGIVNTLTQALPGILQQVGQAIVEGFGGDSQVLRGFGQLFVQYAEKIAQAVPYLLGVVGALLAFNKVKGIGSVFSGLFGGKSGGGGVGGISKIFSDLANAKTGSILKGMVNLAIILGGLTILAAALMAVSPYMATLTDAKSFFQVVTSIAALGVVGTAMAKLAEIAGKIKVGTVAKGLVNIAIILGGLSALYIVVGAVSSLGFDSGKILEIAGVLGVLGTIGAILAVFAGLVGMIPIPAVLTGLANIALVLGGLTALVAAFGALSEIPGIDDFITKGGDFLALLFEQIGKIGGALIGGIGVGISASLPEIGENLSAFGENLKPLFSLVAGADISALSDFFGSLGSFMLMMGGEQILSFFTGGLDTETGTKLAEFARGCVGFFEVVQDIPESAFANGKLLFQSLSDIGNVPKSGGLAQWFGGETNFSLLATGLTALGGEAVLGFFRSVGDLPESGFTNTKALFQSLSDIGNIPNTGGVLQWFTGTDNISGLAKDLPGFGESMASFYTSISGITDFNRIKLLFEALKGVGDAFPESGGLWQWFTGEANIGGVGEQLKKFGEDTKDFFTQANGLNLENLNGLWAAVTKASEVAALDLSGLGDKGTALTEFMDNAKGFFTGAEEVSQQVGAVHSVALSLQDIFIVISGIVATSLVNINAGLGATIVLVGETVVGFTTLSIAITALSASGLLAIQGMVTQANILVLTGFTMMSTCISQKYGEMILNTQTAMASIVSVIQGVNLYDAGVYIMQGLNNGMASMIPVLAATAARAAQTIQAVTDRALSIHSPSRVMYEKGVYTGLGQAYGLESTIPQIQAAATQVAVASIPYGDSYSPEGGTASYSNSRSTEYTTISPQFNLTISGSTDERTMARRVKRWVQEAVDDTFESMGRNRRLVRDY